MAILQAFTRLFDRALGRAPQSARTGGSVADDPEHVGVEDALVEPDADGLDTNAVYDHDAEPKRSDAGKEASYAVGLTVGAIMGSRR